MRSSPAPSGTVWRRPGSPHDPTRRHPDPYPGSHHRDPCPGAPPRQPARHQRSDPDCRRPRRRVASAIARSADRSTGSLDPAVRSRVRDRGGAPRGPDPAPARRHDRLGPPRGVGRRDRRRGRHPALGGPDRGTRLHRPRLGRDRDPARHGSPQAGRARPRPSRPDAQPAGVGRSLPAVGTTDRVQLLRWLEVRRQALAEPEATAWPAWNLGRELARQALAGLPTR